MKESHNPVKKSGELIKKQEKLMKKCDLNDKIAYKGKRPVKEVIKCDKVV